MDMELIVIPVNELETLVKTAVVKAFEKLNEKGKSPESEKEWMTIEELVEYDPEKRGKDTFRRYCKSNLIPFYRQGKRYRFKKSEIDEWLKSSRNRTVTEIRGELDSRLSNG